MYYLKLVNCFTHIKYTALTGVFLLQVLEFNSKEYHESYVSCIYAWSVTVFIYTTELFGPRCAVSRSLD